MGHGTYFVHSATLPGIYLSPCMYIYEPGFNTDEHRICPQTDAIVFSASCLSLANNNLLCHTIILFVLMFMQFKNAFVMDSLI